jgi:hypothetical protein
MQLAVTSESYAPENQNPNDSEEETDDSPRSFEELRLEFTPIDPESSLLPLEDAIFACYHQNKNLPSALENKILRMECNLLEVIESMASISSQSRTPGSFHNPPWR